MMPHFKRFLQLLIVGCLLSRLFVFDLLLLLMMVLSLCLERQRHRCGRLLLLVRGMWRVGQHAAGTEVPERPRQRQRAGRCVNRTRLDDDDVDDEL